MKKKMKAKGIASVEELRDICLESEVKLIGCQMTVDLFDLRRDDLIDGIDYVGAGAFLSFAGDADICLYI